MSTKSIELFIIKEDTIFALRVHKNKSHRFINGVCKGIDCSSASIDFTFELN